MPTRRVDHHPAALFQGWAWAGRPPGRARSWRATAPSARRRRPLSRARPRCRFFAPPPGSARSGAPPTRPRPGPAFITAPPRDQAARHRTQLGGGLGAGAGRSPTGRARPGEGGQGGPATHRFFRPLSPLSLLIPRCATGRDRPINAPARMTGWAGHCPRECRVGEGGTGWAGPSRAGVGGGAGRWGKSESGQAGEEVSGSPSRSSARRPPQSCNGRPRPRPRALPAPPRLPATPSPAHPPSPGCPPRRCRWRARCVERGRGGPCRGNREHGL